MYTLLLSSESRNKPTKNRHDAGSKQQVYTELKKDLTESMNLKIFILLRRRAAYSLDYRFSGLRSCRASEGVPLRRTVNTTGPLNRVYSGIWRICSGLSMETLHHAKNGRGFVDTLGSVRAGPQNITVSFDVVPLFARVFISEAM
jgi:hypothetical protein